jgi:hypothetical protein
MRVGQHYHVSIACLTWLYLQQAAHHEVGVGGGLLLLGQGQTAAGRQAGFGPDAKAQASSAPVTATASSAPVTATASSAAVTACNAQQGQLCSQSAVCSGRGRFPVAAARPPNCRTV